MEQNYNCPEKIIYYSSIFPPMKYVLFSITFAYIFDHIFFFLLLLNLRCFWISHQLFIRLLSGDLWKTSSMHISLPDAEAIFSLACTGEIDAELFKREDVSIIVCSVWDWYRFLFYFNDLANDFSWKLPRRHA